MKLNNLFSLLLSLVFLTTVTSCGDDDDSTTPPVTGPTQNIVEIAAGNPDLTVLVDALEQNPDLVSLLSAPGTNTVFAPTDAAFIALLGVVGQDDLTDIPNDVIRRILQYHVITSAALESGDLSNNQMAETALGEDITVGINGTAVTINNANVVTANVEATNGIIHIIDAVLVPSLEASIVNTIVEPAYFSNDFTILTEAVVTAGLVETLTNRSATFTLFAPTDEAFEAAGITSLDGLTAGDLAPILQYHVLNSVVTAGDLPSTTGGVAETITTLNGDFYLSNNDNGVFINGNTEVIATDLTYDNGVVHVINRTLLPPSDDIVALAIAGGYNALAAALTEANLVTALQDPNGPFTVFAPTDAAFAALYAALQIDGPEDVDPLLGDGTLSAILTYHVLNGRVFSSDLVDGLEPTTLQGGTLVVNIDGSVTLEDKDPDVTDPTVTGTDVLGTNGVIHAIDGVLLPVDTAL
jgi:transforming growth factor-beta-induced protein